MRRKLGHDRFQHYMRDTQINHPRGISDFGAKGNQRNGFVWRNNLHKLRIRFQCFKPR